MIFWQIPECGKPRPVALSPTTRPTGTGPPPSLPRSLRASSVSGAPLAMMIWCVSSIVDAS